SPRMVLFIIKSFYCCEPQEIREKLGLAIGDVVDVQYKDGKIVIEKISGDWEKVMAETAGVWGDHSVFGRMKNSVEVVHWLRGKTERGNRD
ncbi:MAG: AbrB/MazE/SpoVT family DNA-binding domain-containing protein, partial [Candidatus Jordarchaeum sp.]|uniref:AbrB/MazE/SpoVT family DNA-binding domain-containing protein n=1 Tax=Candidatus Jordarchaeum sp. TaxID=2823881 RepID=UPI00404B8E91